VAEIYSHSRLSSFENCPLKFQYRYVLKIPSETESIEAFVGKRVHDVLERLYVAVGKGHVPSLPQVIQRYCQLFDDAYDAERISIVRTENPPEFYRDSGTQCLSNYYRAHYPFDREETLGLEERVSFELGAEKSHRVRFQGFIDRIARAGDGAIEIHDYKTSARVPKQAALDKDRQLALYQIGLTQRYGEEQPMRLVWHYVRHGRTCTSTRSPEQLRDLSERTLQLVARIRAATSFEPRPSALCRWCEFRTRCPASPERDESLAPYDETAQRGESAPSARQSTSEKDAAQTDAADDQLALPLRAIPPLGSG
jgi:putative RecB family exonuclease